MIDWTNLAANSLWIIGCAIALGTLSYASFQASIYRDKFRYQLKRASIQIALGLAGFLFSLGLAATANEIYESLLWLILGGLFLFQMINAMMKKRKRNINPPQESK